MNNIAACCLDEVRQQAGEEVSSFQEGNKCVWR